MQANKKNNKNKRVHWCRALPPRPLPLPCVAVYPHSQTHLSTVFTTTRDDAAGPPQLGTAGVLEQVQFQIWNAPPAPVLQSFASQSLLVACDLIARLFRVAMDASQQGGDDAFNNISATPGACEGRRVRFHRFLNDYLVTDQDAELGSQASQNSGGHPV